VEELRTLRITNSYESSTSKTLGEPALCMSHLCRSIEAAFVFVSVTNCAHESRNSNWRARAVHESLVQVYRSCVHIHTSDSYTARALQLLVRDSCTQFVTDTNKFSQSIGAADSYT